MDIGSWWDEFVFLFDKCVEDGCNVFVDFYYLLVFLNGGCWMGVEWFMIGLK